MALFSSQPTTCIFTDVHSASDVAGATSLALKGTHFMNSRSVEQEGVSTLIHSSSQNNTTARIIPIFKSKLLQVSRVHTNTIDKNNKICVSQNVFKVLSISEKENIPPTAGACKHVIPQTLTPDVPSALKRKINENKDISAKKVYRSRFIHKDKCGAHTVPLKNSTSEKHTMDNSLQESSQSALKKTVVTKGMVKKEPVSRHLKNKNSRSEPPSAPIVETNLFVKDNAQPQKLYLDTKMTIPYVACRTKTQNGEETLHSNVNILDRAVSSTAQKPDADATKNHALKLRREFTMKVSSQCVQFDHRSDQVCMKITFVTTFYEFP
ncbi:hypothetical protein NDU88_005853 [Pleurodeles waltl]|uniref:Uncharacterized protein n=1 Tax=Pleurodeles waltl TaxID=8319 RepID=A0AAV7VPL0_PLEWA|nr:hypothetical protein NDU88_005853 [Pleurodeles waltl]